MEAQLLDLRDFPMPFFDQPCRQLCQAGRHTNTMWLRNELPKLRRRMLLYSSRRNNNYGPSAVLKNEIEWVYPEWNRKAAAFLSYGSAMGARAVQQLRETAIERFRWRRF